MNAAQRFSQTFKSVKHRIGIILKPVRLALGKWTAARWLGKRGIAETDALRVIARHFPDWKTYYEAYCLDEIALLKQATGSRSTSGVISVCCVKDDLARIRAHAAHYRALGVARLVYLDNGSTDGTLEFLLSLDDADVYRTSGKFSGERKAAWNRRLCENYGFGNWYLISDSDELYAYPEIERMDIAELAAELERRGRIASPSFMLDMYEGPGVHTACDDGFTAVYRFFDRDSYSLRPGEYGWVRIEGGPRTRIFRKDRPPFLLSKYPLFKLERDMACITHGMFSPHVDQSELPVGVLLHYKFLPSDVERYAQRVADKTFFNGSEEYREYQTRLDESSTMGFFLEGQSCELCSWEDLYQVKILDRVFWQQVQSDWGRQ